MTSLFWIDYRHTTRTTTRGDITFSNPLKIFRQTEWNCTKAKLSQDALAYIITILTAVSRVKSTSPILSGLANSHHFTLYRTTRVISDQAHFCGRLVFFLLQAKQDASQNTRMCRSSGWEELCEFPSSSVPSRYNMPVESSIKIVRHNLSFIDRELSDLGKNLVVGISPEWTWDGMQRECIFTFCDFTLPNTQRLLCKSFTISLK